MLNDFVKSCLTLNDNETGDVFRVCFLLCVIGFLVLELINYKTYTAMTFGAGMGLIFAAGSSALYIKNGADKGQEIKPLPPI